MVGVKQDKSGRMRYALEKHSHPELGVMGAGRSGEQESWLGTHVFRWFSWTGRCARHQNQRAHPDRYPPSVFGDDDGVGRGLRVVGDSISSRWYRIR